MEVRRLEAIDTPVDEDKIRQVKSDLEALFSGQTLSESKEADFIRLNSMLFEACGCDDQRMIAEFNSCLGIAPDEPTEPHLRVAGERI